jgi:hypothetical protein
MAALYKKDSYECERDKLTANFKGQALRTAQDAQLTGKEAAAALLFGEQASESPGSEK